MTLQQVATRWKIQADRFVPLAESGRILLLALATLSKLVARKTNNHLGEVGVLRIDFRIQSIGILSGLSGR